MASYLANAHAGTGDDIEYTEEQSIRTVIIPLRSITNRKANLIEAMFDEASEMRQVADNRMVGLPMPVWKNGKSKGNPYDPWAQEHESFLSNTVLVENIQNVRESYQSWRQGERKEQPTFEWDSRIRFKQDKMTYLTPGDDDLDSYGLLLSFKNQDVDGEEIPHFNGGDSWGREFFPVEARSDYVSSHIDRLADEDDDLSLGRAELLRRDGQYEFHQVVKETVEVYAEPQTMVGVDVNLRNLAVVGARTEDGKEGANIWSGSEAAHHRDRLYEQRKRAQETGAFEKIKDQESRYVDHVCHEISAGVVEWAQQYEQPQIVLEDLTHIRDSMLHEKEDLAPDDTRRLHSWPFRKMQDYIAYKATRVGIPVEEVKPHGTSLECNECGHTSKANRPEGAIEFNCVDCGYEVHSDVNAAFNIAERGW